MIVKESTIYFIISEAIFGELVELCLHEVKDTSLFMILSLLIQRDRVFEKFQGLTQN
jgi:hypothetical protein